MRKIKILWRAVKLSFSGNCLLSVAHQLITIVYGISYGWIVLLSQRLVQASERFIRSEILLYEVIWQLLFLLLFVFLNFFLNQVCNNSYATTASHIEIAATEKIFQKLADCEPILYEQSGFRDRLETVSGVTQPIGYVGLVVVSIITGTIVSLVSIIAVLASAHIYLAFMMLLISIPSVVTFFFKLDLFDEAKEELAQESRVLAVNRDMLVSSEFVKESRTIGANDYLYNQYEAQQKRYAAKEIAVKQQAQRYDRRFRLIAVVCNALSLVLLIYLLGSKQIEVATFAAAFTAIASFNFLVEQLFFNELDLIGEMYGELVLYYDFLDEQMTERQDVSLTSAPAIEFRDVSFCYPENSEMVIANLSFSLKGKERLAVVGQNGAGKTTLAKLAAGIYIPTSGDVYINGLNTKQYRFRKSISLVSQNYQSYKMSLQDNIALASWDSQSTATSEKEKLSSFVQRFLARFRHPDLTKDTILSQEFGGIELSGGWKQIVAVGRAAYREAHLMVLDEPSSAIDPILEKDLSAYIIEQTENKTSVLVTHRMALTKAADKILFLEGGKLLEYGDFKMLYQDEQSRFREYYVIQEEWYA